MLTTIDWMQATAEAARSLLADAELVCPPVDALAIARATGSTIALDETQLGRGRIKRIHGRPVIFLKPDDRPERLQWAAAHELGESLAGQVCLSLGLDGRELLPQQREEIANQLAKELLLPRDWFRRDCQRFGYDLLQLKSRFSTASHELIAWRWLDLESPTIVTLFDQGTMTRRRGNGPTRAPAMTAMEGLCWERLRKTRAPAVVSQQPVEVQGWCIDSPDWRREILLTRWSEADE